MGGAELELRVLTPEERGARRLRKNVCMFLGGMIIIGIVLSFSVLSLGGDRRGEELDREARQFTELFRLAAERKALYDQMVERMYQHGKAVSTASHFEIDDVIDPAESRTWITRTLRSVPPPAPRTGKKRPCVDTW